MALQPASYKLKTISFGPSRRAVRIVIQNENGPCPLLAIANVLLLRNAIQLPAGAPDVTQERLVSLVAGHLLDANSEERLRAASPEYCANVRRRQSPARPASERASPAVASLSRRASCGLSGRAVPADAALEESADAGQRWSLPARTALGPLAVLVHSSDCLSAHVSKPRRAPGRSAQDRIGSARPHQASSDVAEAKNYPLSQRQKTMGCARVQVRQSIADVIALLPKLATGVDVNVRFHDVRAFEYTDDVAIFPLLDIDLVHGWLVEPRVRTWRSTAWLQHCGLADGCQSACATRPTMRRCAGAPAGGQCHSVWRGEAGRACARRCNRPAAGPALWSAPRPPPDARGAQDPAAAALAGRSYNEVVAQLVTALGGEPAVRALSPCSSGASPRSAAAAAAAGGGGAAPAVPAAPGPSQPRGAGEHEPRAHARGERPVAAPHRDAAAAAAAPGSEGGQAGGEGPGGLAGPPAAVGAGAGLGAAAVGAAPAHAASADDGDAAEREEAEALAAALALSMADERPPAAPRGAAGAHGAPAGARSDADAPPQPAGAPGPPPGAGAGPPEAVPGAEPAGPGRPAAGGPAPAEGPGAAGALTAQSLAAHDRRSREQPPRQPDTPEQALRRLEAASLAQLGGGTGGEGRWNPERAPRPNPGPGGGGGASLLGAPSSTGGTYGSRAVPGEGLGAEGGGTEGRGTEGGGTEGGGTDAGPPSTASVSAAGSALSLPALAAGGGRDGGAPAQASPAPASQKDADPLPALAAPAGAGGGACAAGAPDQAAPASAAPPNCAAEPAEARAPVPSEGSATLRPPAPGSAPEPTQEAAESASAAGPEPGAGGGAAGAAAQPSGGQPAEGPRAAPGGAAAGGPDAVSAAGCEPAGAGAAEPGASGGPKGEAGEPGAGAAGGQAPVRGGADAVDGQRVRDARRMHAFLERSRSQLTEHGLVQLHQARPHLPPPPSPAGSADNLGACM